MTEVPTAHKICSIDMKHAQSFSQGCQIINSFAENHVPEKQSSVGKGLVWYTRMLLQDSGAPNQPFGRSPGTIPGTVMQQ